jgi:hypothetical protein
MPAFATRTVDVAALAPDRRRAVADQTRFVL